MYTYVFFFSFFSFMCVLVAQSCPILCYPMDCSLSGSSAHGIPGKNTELGCCVLLQGDLPNPGNEPWSPASQADYFIYSSMCILNSSY